MSRRIGKWKVKGRNKVSISGPAFAQGVDKSLRIRVARQRGITFRMILVSGEGTRTIAPYLPWTLPFENVECEG